MQKNPDTQTTQFRSPDPKSQTPKPNPPYPRGKKEIEQEKKAPKRTILSPRTLRWRGSRAPRISTTTRITPWASIVPHLWNHPNQPTSTTTTTATPSYSSNPSPVQLSLPQVPQNLTASLTIQRHNAQGSMQAHNTSSLWGSPCSVPTRTLKNPETRKKTPPTPPTNTNEKTSKNGGWSSPSP